MMRTIQEGEDQHIHDFLRRIVDRVQLRVARFERNWLLLLPSTKKARLFQMRMEVHVGGQAVSMGADVTSD